MTDCVADDPLCVSRSIVLSRIRPASGDLWDDSGIDLAGSLPALETTTDVKYASLAANAGSLATAWQETSTSTEPNTPWSLRMARIDPSGTPSGEPTTEAQGYMVLAAGTPGEAIRLPGSTLARSTCS